MDMGKVKIAGGSYAPRCDLSELRVHYRRGEARLTAGRSAQLIRENRQRRASPAGPRNAALGVLPLACISALVGINDLISFLQPMIFFFFFLLALAGRRGAVVLRRHTGAWLHLQEQVSEQKSESDDNVKVSPVLFVPFRWQAGHQVDTRLSDIVILGQNTTSSSWKENFKI